MGIRMDQFMGLPSEAVSFLAEYESPLKICPECKRPFPRDLEVISHYLGMFDEEYPLHRHVLSDGRVADEFLQAEPWSSGPMHFLGLRVLNARLPVPIIQLQKECTEFVWSDEEIDQLSQ